MNEKTEEQENTYKPTDLLLILFIVCGAVFVFLSLLLFLDQFLNYLGR